MCVKRTENVKCNALKNELVKRSHQVIIKNISTNIWVPLSQECLCFLEGLLEHYFTLSVLANHALLSLWRDSKSHLWWRSILTISSSSQQSIGWGGGGVIGTFIKNKGLHQIQKKIRWKINKTKVKCQNLVFI